MLNTQEQGAVGGLIARKMMQYQEWIDKEPPDEQIKLYKERIAILKSAAESLGLSDWIEIYNGLVKEGE